MSKILENKALRHFTIWMKDHIDVILLVSLILTGWFIRLIIAVNTGGLAHADEVYQSLEIAHKMKYGTGLIPWEFTIPTSPQQDGAARSYLYPLIFYAIFSICELLGIPYGIEGTLRVVRIFSATWSTLLIPIVFYVSKELLPEQKKPYIFSLFSAFLVIVAFEFSFFGIRTLTNSFVTVLIFLGIYLHLITSKNMKDWSNSRILIFEIAAGAIFGISCAIRMDSPVFFVPFFLIRHKNNRKTLLLYILLLFGFVGAFIIQGMTDLVYYGTFLISPFNWVRYNFLEGKSAQWGTEPFYFYFELLFIVKERTQLFYPIFFSLVFFILVINVYRFLRYRRIFDDTWFFSFLQLFVWVLISLVILSLVAHKEARFIFSLYPIIMILFATTMKGCFNVIESLMSYVNSSFLPKLKIKHIIPQNKLGVIQISFLALSCLFAINANIQTSSSTIYWSWYHDVNLALEWVGRQEDSTGVITLVPWYDIGGWTYLHKNISWWYYGNPHSSDDQWIHQPPSFNYLITRQDIYELEEGIKEQIMVNFTLVKSMEVPNIYGPNRADIWRR